MPHQEPRPGVACGRLGEQGRRVERAFAEGVHQDREPVRLGEFEGRRVLGRIDRHEMVIGPELEPDEARQVWKPRKSRAVISGELGLITQ